MKDVSELRNLIIFYLNFSSTGDGRRVPSVEQSQDLRIPMPGQDQSQRQGRNDDLLLDRPSRGLHHEDGRLDDAAATTATAATTTIHSATAAATSASDTNAATTDFVAERDER